MTTVRLVGANNADKAGYLRKGLGAVESRRYRPPALLVSWWYWSKFAKERPHYTFRDYSLDSGAWSAWNSGVTIDLDEYIEGVRELMATDSQMAELFALDVIGDWKRSIRNTERMWEAGIPAIPTYHLGEPEHVLKHLATNYPKIAIGGAVGYTAKRKLAWASQVFARVWPKPIHGLGMASRNLLMSLPFHSVDATDWEMSPVAWGNWKSMPGGNIRGSNQPLRMEVEWYLRLEEAVQARWSKQMTELQGMLDSNAAQPAVRMAVIGTTRTRQALGGES